MEAEMGRRPDVEASPEPGIVAEPEPIKSPDRSLWDRLHLSQLHNFFGRDDSRARPIQRPELPSWPDAPVQQPDPDVRRNVSTRPVGVGLPRQPTFRRQNSEKRDRLFPHHLCSAERRALSMSRQNSLSVGPTRSKSSPPAENLVRSSAPVLPQPTRLDYAPSLPDGHLNFSEEVPPFSLEPVTPAEESRPPRAPSRTSSDDSMRDRDRFHELDERAQLNAELDSKWILNLSMHFRDNSDREKFFVTYAERPNRWRRVTVSCDYRNAEPGSLEMDLRELRFQRDKNFHIYESIRDSLPDIHFFDTVTNLKLETSDGRLHVHVTEDVNEIIPYPAKSTVAHILEDDEFRPMEVLESELKFDSHLSGFVYKVDYRGTAYIKKEIPGPDTIDEFLYEINALHALHYSDRVIQLEAIVLDDSRQVVKGLLISFAERGAIVDLLFDHKGEIPWEDRLRWAMQAVKGLSEIHEEGYVQGDFTLSNIVVDNENNAQIIDINRRGCPVGWEPPEIAKKIASNQRISMYIGEKSDLYQLGMSLWALAMDDDEPERHDPPLSTEQFPSEVQEWYQEIVRICLAPQPRDRLSAKELLLMFETPSSSETRALEEPGLHLPTRDSQEFIDPSAAVERDDLERFSREPTSEEDFTYTPGSSFDDWTYTFPRSSNYEYESASSQVERPRGRRPLMRAIQLDRRQQRLTEENMSPADGDDDLPPDSSTSPEIRSEYEEVTFDGYRYPIPKCRSENAGLGISDGRLNDDVQSQDEAAIETRESAFPELPKLITSTEATVQEEDIQLDPPEPYSHQDLSVASTSNSTPRNANSAVASSLTLASATSGSLVLDMPSPDLAGFGTHPDLEQYSPHEPKASISPNPAEPHDQICEDPVVELKTIPAHKEDIPPTIPWTDSGFDEPINFEKRLNLLDLERSAERTDENDAEIWQAQAEIDRDRFALDQTAMKDILPDLDLLPPLPQSPAELKPISHNDLPLDLSALELLPPLPPSPPASPHEGAMESFISENPIGSIDEIPGQDRRCG